MSSVITAALRELMAAGVAGEELIAAVERIELAQVPKRSAHAERQARYAARKRQQASASVSNDASGTKKPVPTDDDVEVVDEDSRARLWRKGKTILVSFGVAEKRTGALIGQWLKVRDDPVGLLAVLQFARDQNVAEPVAYISALLGKRKNGGNHDETDRRPNEGLGDYCRRLAERARDLETRKAAERTPDGFGSH